MVNPTYQVKGWSDNFEVAKSKTYKNKNICQMPMKKGIGYRRLVRAENGPAMFGAWCAMVQTLSAHQPPREGFVTHDGTPDGKPYSPGDLELLTDISADVFSRLLIIASSQDVEWLDLVSAGDTTGIPDGYHKDSSGSPHSNSNLNTNLNINPEKPKPKPPTPTFDSPPMQAAWDEWVTFKTETRKKLTPSVIKKQVKKLETMGEVRAIACINHSIENGYVGLFEPKKDKASGGLNNTHFANEGRDKSLYSFGE